MAADKRSAGSVRKGERVGPDYPQSHYENPFNDGIDSWYDAGDGKRTLVSPTANTIEHVDQPLRKGAYDRLWEGK